MTLNNLELMRTLDDAWNAQDWATFEKRHSKDTTVFWPGQAEPTRGRDNHKAESVEFFKTFPDNHLINHPYKVEIPQGDWTCTVADFTGTMRGPMKGSDGKLIAPTNKKFHIEFCTVAHWKNGEIIEAKLIRVHSCQASRNREASGWDGHAKYAPSPARASQLRRSKNQFREIWLAR